MDDKPNVNNLNGVPNFGHGFDAPDETSEETKEVIEDQVELSESNEE